MLEKNRMPYHWRKVEDGVQGRTGDLSQRPCGYGNDMSRTSVEIDKNSRTSIEIDKRSRTWIEIDKRVD